MTIITPRLQFLEVQNQNFPGGACPQTSLQPWKLYCLPSPPPLISNPESAPDVCECIEAHFILRGLMGQAGRQCVLVLQLTAN